MYLNFQPCICYLYSLPIITELHSVPFTLRFTLKLTIVVFLLCQVWGTYLSCLRIATCSVLHKTYFIFSQFVHCNGLLYTLLGNLPYIPNVKTLVDLMDLQNSCCQFATDRTPL